ncbi:hypothetical protein FHX82_003746 [Amycolatopsis bartoniae]|uniref:FHA domain-containing protein n=1 Tax=Amycolatopsis bartoniae TaxID=941986 RepID=A0A8H9IXW5_9PSEU|nr:FHA domain-containing protein [Amycolatopsis bartoniae]MBB2936682.1 hypothetical protein [Amycolatopsis bartoniae]TVT09740.1 FHA domain-containing protein [Amycolatopsis bartoniae]GHF67135.1 hypothetical protein GCM10017566_46060 [Amycolatopsis bartoniae]
MPVCARGHESADEEFCDVCGLAFDGAPEVVAERPQPCPACGTQLAGRFCETCGADSLGSPEVRTWSVVVTADERYFRAVQADGGPDTEPIRFPPYCPERHFPLGGEQVTIGRRSRTRGITPDIDLTGPPEDIGVSRLHALLVPGEDGWAVVDMNSANGTYLNYSRKPIEPSTPCPLKDGDRVHLGAWTTLTLRECAP